MSTGPSFRARGKLNWLNWIELNCIGLRFSLHQNAPTREVVVFKDAVYSKMVKDLKVTKHNNRRTNVTSHQRSMSQKFEREDLKGSSAERETGGEKHLTAADRRIRRSSSNQ